jgi:hypothetical protein
MTRYTVVWVASAQAELADEWLGATNRNAVTGAAAAIDRELSQDASTKGVEVSEGLRAYFTAKLKVLFAVREDDRVVEVLRVRRV